MNDKRPVPVDLDQLSKDLIEPGRPVRVDRPKFTPTQVIGHAITMLTWREAEIMGAAIQALIKDGTSLTAAIVQWAEKWEELK